jgi:hypothetical protein
MLKKFLLTALGGQKRGNILHRPQSLSTNVYDRKEKEDILKSIGA